MFRAFRRSLHTLPFRITRQQANAKFAESGFLEQTPSNVSLFKKETQVELFKKDSVSENYVPFHSMDVSGLVSDYEGEYGRDRLETYTTVVYNAASKSMEVQTHTRVVTDWFAARGRLAANDYPLGTTGTQIYAGFQYPRKFVEQVLRTQYIYRGLQPLKKDNRLRIIQPHEMNYAFALEKIVSALSRLETKRAEVAILREHRADHARLRVAPTMYLSRAEIVPHSYFVPAYVYEYELQKYKVFKFVNGYTGEMEGEKINSFWKSLAFGTGMGGIATFVGTAFLFPYIAGRQLLLRTLFGAATSGLSFATIMRAYSISKNNTYREKIQEETKQNASYMETDEDIQRRNFASAFIDVIHSKEKYILLGLDPKKELTIEELKNCYRQQVQLWHPDVYKGDKKIALDMMIQINDAYGELQKHTR
ncbi:MAG: DnaJ-like subfamily C member 3 [Harvfovirus sp.]|uniref:DnaJ-like subfamily C member 3 n=1 Tax=Harvfovirus sp. TaxID=2487768 RepID=A0A3G5A740_9VIRU|nr:MAG: DnaJ-like subfamily C member 3 [Harvfovirus sp.]